MLKGCGVKKKRKSDREASIWGDHLYYLCNLLANFDFMCQFWQLWQNNLGIALWGISFYAWVDKPRDIQKSFHFPLCGIFLSYKSSRWFSFVLHCTVSPIISMFLLDWGQHKLQSRALKESKTSWKSVFLFCSTFRKDVVISFWCYTHTGVEEDTTFTWVKVVIPQCKNSLALKIILKFWTAYLLCVWKLRLSLHFKADFLQKVWYYNSKRNISSRSHL